jgi:hypothetical protein
MAKNPPEHNVDSLVSSVPLVPSISSKKPKKPKRQKRLKNPKKPVVVEASLPLVLAMVGSIDG